MAAKVEVKMELARETKNTYRFECKEDGAAVDTLYVQKSAFPSGAPMNVTISVS